MDVVSPPISTGSDSCTGWPPVEGPDAFGIGPFHAVVLCLNEDGRGDLLPQRLAEIRQVREIKRAASAWSGGLGAGVQPPRATGSMAWSQLPGKAGGARKPEPWHGIRILRQAAGTAAGSPETRR